MKTIALRFGEHFSPECGTIAAHQEIINKQGYVWYGKLGAIINGKIRDELQKQENPKILLINSGKTDRYWAYFKEISLEQPPIGEFPSYYQDKAEKMKTWFKVTSFELAPKGIMSQCVVTSSGSLLSEASKHSMSPYFKIRYDEEVSE